MNRRILRLLAVAIILTAVAFWAAKGAHLGWTRHQVPVTIVDEVTGLEGQRFEKRYVPGLDFLGQAALAAGILVCASALFRKTGGKTVSTFLG